MTTHDVDHVAVWSTPRDQGYRTDWSISLCDDDGDEIECSGGANSRSRAWEIALERAESLGVPARLLDEHNNVMQEWEPPAKDSDDDA